VIGKPAKGAESIRSALRSVAAAREKPIEKGPLSAGLTPDSWVVAALGSRWVDPAVYKKILSAWQISSRLVKQGRRDALEVRAKDYSTAREAIGKQLAEERACRQSLRQRGLAPRKSATAASPSFTVYLSVGFILGPLLAFLTVCSICINWGATEPPPAALLIGVMIAIFALCPLLAIVLHAIIRGGIR